MFQDRGEVDRDFSQGGGGLEIDLDADIVELAICMRRRLLPAGAQLR